MGTRATENAGIPANRSQRREYTAVIAAGAMFETAMTNNWHSLVVSNTEMTTLNVAIEALLQRCAQEMEEGPRAPYWGWRIDAKAIQARLHTIALQCDGVAVHRHRDQRLLNAESPEFWRDRSGA